MSVSRLWVKRYRSLLDVHIDLHRVTVIQGFNATGKTNLYRALLLLSRGASGRLARTLLDEGGMPSALFAGQAGWSTPVRMRFGVAIDELSYELSLGLPSVDPTTTPFSLDAEIKEEVVWFGPKHTRRSELLDRRGSTATAKDADGATATFATVLDRFEPAISQLGEPARFPELYYLRERMKQWRFYHQIPSGADAPARSPRPGVRTPVLADDGRDLAAALATIDDMGSGPRLRDAVEDAFPGCGLAVTAERGVFRLGLQMPGLVRPMQAQELSDGTLRYLSLAAALLTPRPPELLVLNEPETSLHGSLIRPLARLISEAGRYSQIVVTTHSPELAATITNDTGIAPITLNRSGGATTIDP